MGKHIRLRKGFDINLAGKASPTITTTDQPDVFAVKPTDFQGVYLPRVLVNVGDTVKAGAPLFRDKRFEKVLFTAPVSGEVIEVKRGEKRKLLEVEILAAKSLEHADSPKYSAGGLASISREAAQDQLPASGVWPNLVQRPFGVIADPGETPKAIC